MYCLKQKQNKIPKAIFAARLCGTKISQRKLNTGTTTTPASTAASPASTACGHCHEFSFWKAGSEKAGENGDLGHVPVLCVWMRQHQEQWRALPRGQQMALPQGHPPSQGGMDITRPCTGPSQMDECLRAGTGGGCT